MALFFENSIRRASMISGAAGKTHSEAPLPQESARVNPGVGEQAFSRKSSLPAGRSLADHMAAMSASAAPGVQVQKPCYIVYTKTDDMLYSGGNGSGLSYYIKYAPESTEEEPVVIAKGVDENGAEFEQTIHINDINPQYATLVEMHALEGHLGVEKLGGMTSLPFAPSMGSMGLHDRGNFIDMFRNAISNMNLLKQKQAAAYYEYSMQAYLDFMYHKF